MSCLLRKRGGADKLYCSWGCGLFQGHKNANKILKWINQPNLLHWNIFANHNFSKWSSQLCYYYRFRTTNFEDVLKMYYNKIMWPFYHLAVDCFPIAAYPVVLFSKKSHLSFYLHTVTFNLIETSFSLRGFTFQLPAARFCSAPAAPSSVSGFEHSESSKRYGFTMEGCHNIWIPLGGSAVSERGPTPSHCRRRQTEIRFKRLQPKKSETIAYDADT